MDHFFGRRSATISLIQIITLVIGLLAGLLYLNYASKEDLVRRSRDELKEFLEVKRQNKTLLLEIFKDLDYLIELNINKQAFASFVMKWYNTSLQNKGVKHHLIYIDDFQSILDEIGQEDFFYLLLTKSESNGFLSVNDTDKEMKITLNLA